MKRTRWTLGLAMLAGSAFAQGPLMPSDGPGPVMKSLSELEPRTPIVSLPATILTPGSYYLATNLVCTTLGANGITINANNVTIDLCGFTISRNASGIGYGIYQPSPDTALLTVRNGTLSGWTIGVRALGMKNQFQNVTVENNGAGILAGNEATLTGCRAFNNVGDTAGYGLNAGDHSTISKCTASSNSATGGSASTYGIHGGAGSVISECVADRNRPTSWFSCGIYAAAGSVVDRCAASENIAGIYAERGVAISDCLVTRNNGVGIQLAEASRVSGCLVAMNNGQGILGSGGCMIERCLIASNAMQGVTVGVGSTVQDCDVVDSGMTGIDANSDCHLLRNHCVGNGLSGIYVNGQGARIEYNLSSLNSRGINLAQDNNLVICNAVRANSTADYTFSPYTDYGAVLVNPGLGFANSNAWANFQF